MPPNYCTKFYKIIHTVNIDFANRQSFKVVYSNNSRKKKACSKSIMSYRCNFWKLQSPPHRRASPRWGTLVDDEKDDWMLRNCDSPQSRHLVAAVTPPPLPPPIDDLTPLPLMTFMTGQVCAIHLHTAAVAVAVVLVVRHLTQTVWRKSTRVSGVGGRSNFNIRSPENRVWNVAEP